MLYLTLQIEADRLNVIVFPPINRSNSMTAVEFSMRILFGWLVFSAFSTTLKTRRWKVRVIQMHFSCIFHQLNSME